MRLLLPLFLMLAAVGCASSGSSPSRGDGRAKVPILAFNYLDENGDASVDGLEFQKVAAAMFNRLDEDKDGVLTEEEYKKLAQPAERRRQRSGGRRGGGRRGF